MAAQKDDTQEVPAGASTRDTRDTGVTGDTRNTQSNETQSTPTSGPSSPRLSAAAADTSRSNAAAPSAATPHRPFRALANYHVGTIRITIQGDMSADDLRAVSEFEQATLGPWYSTRRCTGKVLLVIGVRMPLTLAALMLQHHLLQHPARRLEGKPLTGSGHLLSPQLAHSRPLICAL